MYHNLARLSLKILFLYNNYGAKGQLLVLSVVLLLPVSPEVRDLTACSAPPETAFSAVSSKPSIRFFLTAVTVRNTLTGADST